MAADEGESSASAGASLDNIQDHSVVQGTLTDMRLNFQNSIDMYAIVLVLLASITYVGFLQPPGSFDEDGLIRTSSNRRLRWFVYFNSLSFFFSMTDLLLCLGGKYAPMPDLSQKSKNYKAAPSKATNLELARGVLYTLMKLLGINLLFMAALSCCMAAYLSAGSAVLKFSIHNQLPILVPAIIGCSLYFAFILLLFFLVTLPTLRFFCCGSKCSSGKTSAADTTTKLETSDTVPDHQRRSCCCCEGYINQLASKLLDIARSLDVQQAVGITSFSKNTSRSASRGNEIPSSAPPPFHAENNIQEKTGSDNIVPDSSRSNKDPETTSGCFFCCCTAAALATTTTTAALSGRTPEQAQLVQQNPP